MDRYNTSAPVGAATASADNQNVAFAAAIIVVVTLAVIGTILLAVGLVTL